ncbi:MAG: glycosyltransferase family 4 protein [Chloroflexota bacterium]
MKIAHITTIDMSLDYLLRNHLLDLQQRGHEIVGISAPGPYFPALEEAGIRYIPVAMTRRVTPLADLISLWQLYRVLKKEKFSLIHTHTPKANLLAPLAGWLAGIPVRVSTVHGLYCTPQTPQPQRFLLRLMEKLSAIATQVSYQVNQEDVDSCTSLKITSKAKLLPGDGTGVNIAQFHPAKKTLVDKAALRTELGLPPTGKVVGFVARLREEKGILEFLQAAKQIDEHVPDASFLIVGPIDHEKSDAITPDVAVEYGIADKCYFAGNRTDLVELFSLMDLFVLPSHREGFPRTLMEAAAMGLPRVVTDVRGCRDAVENGRNGFVVPLGDVPALANAITTLLTDEQLAHRMGEAGRQMAVEQFDDRLVFDQIHAEYERLCQLKIKNYELRKVASATSS